MLCIERRKLSQNINKWKNHFVEMKEDVGMSVHEKGGKQVNATPTHKTIYNPIPASKGALSRSRLLLVFFATRPNT